MNLRHLELVTMLGKARANDISLEGLVRAVAGVEEGGKLDMLQNSINI